MLYIRVKNIDLSKKLFGVDAKLTKIQFRSRKEKQLTQIFNNSDEWRKKLQISANKCLTFQIKKRNGNVNNGYNKSFNHNHHNKSINL